MKCLKQHIKKLTREQYKMLIDYSHYSNNLYNYSLYIAKQHYKQTGKYIGLKELSKQVKSNENYKLLPIQSSQQIIRLIDKNFRSFFALLRKSKLGQYNDQVNEPKFKKKGGMFNIIYTFQNCKLINNELVFYKGKEYKKMNKTKLKIPFTYNIDGKIKQIIIRPYNNGQYFKMFIQYEENKKQTVSLNKSNYLSIDLGIDNLVSCFINKASSGPFIINGKPLKSYNRWYNKTVAKVKSELKKKNNLSWSKKLQLIHNKRNNWIDNHFNLIVNYIIKYCLKNNIGNIVVGYSDNWKKNVNLGKINNQKFVSIPHLKLKQKLENKCDDYEINFIDREESYTSKCSFIDKEKVEKQDNYLGKRTKRGLFKTKEGKLINADINGAANIMRKVIGDVIYDQPISGLIFNPIKLNVL